MERSLKSLRIRSFVLALIVALTIASAITFPPTNPQQPPTLQNRGVVWGN